MTYTVCYWDNETKSQKERDATPSEVAEIEARKAESVAQAAQAFQAAVVTATQARLDTFANTRNYDGILSACTYATSSVPRFAADGQTAVDLRDATWATLYTLMGEVQAGTRPMPGTADEVLALLPELTWPV